MLLAFLAVLSSAEESLRETDSFLTPVHNLLSLFPLSSTILRRQNLVFMKQFLLPLCIFSAIVISWDNFNPKESTHDCLVNGMYSGSTTTFNGRTFPLSYDFKDNNFAVGCMQNGKPAIFGSYTNDCDSITISVCNNENKSYYLLKGTVSTDHTTIKGTYQNETSNTDKGTFTLRKH